MSNTQRARPSAREQAPPELQAYAQEWRCGFNGCAQLLGVYAMPNGGFYRTRCPKCGTFREVLIPERDSKRSEQESRDDQYESVMAVLRQNRELYDRILARGRQERS